MAIAPLNHAARNAFPVIFPSPPKASRPRKKAARIAGRAHPNRIETTKSKRRGCFSEPGTNRTVYNCFILIQFSRNYHSQHRPEKARPLSIVSAWLWIIILSKNIKTH